MLSVVMLSVKIFYCYAECYMLSVVMLNVVVLSVVAPLEYTPWGSTHVGYSLALNYQIKVEVADNDKHTSLKSCNYK